MASPFCSSLTADPSQRRSAARFTADLGERGVAALEFAIIAAGLFLFIMMTFDISQAILAYTTLTSNAREAARTGSRTAELEHASAYTDLFSTATTTERNACKLRLSSAYPCGQLLVQMRLRYLTQISNLDSSISNISIESQYFPAGSGSGVKDDTLRVRISGSYNGIFLRGLPISTEILAPYLYNNIS